MTQGTSTLQKQSAHTLLFNIATVFFGLSYNILVSRRLGPEGKGLIDLSSATIGLLVLVQGLSLNVGLTQLTAARGTPPPGLRINLLLLSPALIIPGIILLFPLQSLALRWGLLPGTHTGIWALIAAAGSFLGLLAYLFRAVVIGLYGMIICNRIDFSARVMIFCGVLMLFLPQGFVSLFSHPAFLIALAALTAAAMQAIAYASIARPVMDEGRTGTAKTIREALRISMPMYAANIMFFINHKADLFFLSASRPVSDIGIYALAVSLTQLLLHCSSAFAQPLLPTIAAAGRNSESALEITAAACRCYLIIAVSAAAAISAAAPFMLSIVFGPRFQESIPSLLILLPGVIAFGLSDLLIAHFVGVGRQLSNLGVSSVSMVITIVGNFVFTPNYGPIAAAFVSTASYTLSAALFLFLFTRGSQMPLRSLFIPRREDFHFLRAAFARFKP